MSGSYKTVSSHDRSSNVQSFNIGRNSEADSIRFKRYKMIKNKICGAFSLCIVGVILLVCGVFFMVENRPGYIPFMLLGFISIIPGSYGAYEVIGTLQGWNGFDQLLDSQAEQDIDDEEALNKKGWLDF